jgi:uncharacterized OsmC-like protein
MMQTQTATPMVINGLNTETLTGLIDVLEAHPKGGRVTFSSTSRWQDGARSFTSFGGYTVDGQPQHQDKRHFVVLGDEPVEFSGSDTTPGPVEALMYAVGTCIAATTNANAALMGVSLTRLEVALESDLDLHGIFGIDPNVRPGISELRATIRIAGNADQVTLQKIAQRGYAASPVRDSVEHGVTIRPVVEATR